ncbi:MAG: hypothetical protein P1U59_02250 [Alcanivorax sp.]|uniref:hypothetical protein n=1 Tax=Alcanivorax sp. TaxID=1872427 RepID=UPI0026172AEC|nr:hypothetical protein [Alcanivorax sp.]MDF1723307.1 hypothetical protein [Alcanivorax sp.]
MKKVMLIGLTAAIFSQVAQASEVAAQDVTTFSSNSPALASEVNGNFQTLIAAINDNAQRIADLEASATSDVSGRTYLYRDLGLIVGAHNAGTSTAMPNGSNSVQDGFARVGYFNGAFNIAFNEDGTFTLVGSDSQVEMFVNSSSEIGSEEESVSESGTWTQSGHSVTLTPAGEEPFEINVSANGQVLSVYDSYGPDVNFEYNDGSSDIYQHEYETILGIGILINTP